MTPAEIDEIALAIRFAQSHNPWPTPEYAAGAALMKRSIASNIAYVLGKNNPRLRQRFLMAAGVSE